MDLRGTMADETHDSSGNLARERDAFFGRARELAALEELFEGGARLVTLFGPGGIGKTRLSRRFGTATRRFAGVWFCDLSAARDERDVLFATARALGVSLPKSADATATIGRALAAKKNALVVVDNCEQVVTHASLLVSTWLDAAPEASFLATSRETLHVAGERTFEVLPLPLASDAHALFVARARLVRPEWTSDRDASLVASLLEKLEGIPLAIELAAARMRVLDVRTLSEKVVSRLAMLSAGPRAAKDRHGSLRAALEWSWTTLEEWEARAFAQASVFEGGFSLDAAESVLDVGAPALDALHALADKSLLRAYEPEGFPGELRYRMLETVRELAAEKLATSADVETTRTRHARHYLKTGTSWEAETWHGGVESPRRLALDLENLLAVHRRARAARSTDALQAAIALFPIFATRGPFDAFLALLDPAADELLLEDAPPDLRARYLIVRGRARQITGRRADSGADYAAALREARKTSDAVLTARALVYVGTSERLEGRLADARDRFEAALHLFDESVQPRASAIVLSALGAIDLVTGELKRARNTLLRAIDTLAGLGDRSARAMVQIDFGLVEQELGEIDAARTAFEDALAVHRDAGNRRFTAIALGYRAGLELESGDLDRALDLYDESLATIAGMGDTKLEAVFGAARAVVLAKRGAIDESTRAFDAAEASATAQGEPRVIGTVAVHRGHLDLAHGDARAAAERRAAAAGLLASSDDVRFALRLLDAALGASGSTALARSSEALAVAHDGSWFRAPGATERAELGKKAILKRILTELARRRVDSPGAPVAREELVAVGWPGEKLSPDVAHNRLGVALSELRRAGLRDALLHDGGGHLLDPSVPIVLERDD